MKLTNGFTKNTKQRSKAIILKEYVAEANAWFIRVHGPDRQEKKWDVIYFAPEWIPQVRR